MPQASFDFGYIPPNQSSQGTLSTGLYSLSSRSNVPYAALVGRSGYYKEFSWGEIVEVPKREQCTVKNASYHGGDVVINAGADYDTRPARITVPVPIVQAHFPEGGFIPPSVLFWTGEFPADVRLARRAYITINILTEDAPGMGLQVITLGKRFDGSHNTQNMTTGSFAPGTGYYEETVLPPGSAWGLFPLGKGAAPGDDSRPMALLTTGQVYYFPIDNATGILHDNAYYIMEY